MKPKFVQGLDVINYEDKHLLNESLSLFLSCFTDGHWDILRYLGNNSSMDDVAKGLPMT